METYIELVIINNFVLTAIIGAASYRFLCIKNSNIRLFLASAVGTVLALVFPLIKLHAVIITLLKIAMGLLLSVILFAKKCRFFKGFFSFMVITFMFGGLQFCIGMMIFGNVADALSKPATNIPIGIIVGGSALLYIFIKKLFITYRRLSDESHNIIDFSVELAGKKINAKGFLDTGNRLYDNQTGLPVVVLNIKTLLPYLSDGELTLMLSGNSEKLFKNAHYISFSSLNNTGDRILVVQPDRFQVYFDKSKNILYDVMIGLSFSKLSGGTTEYDALLPPCIINS